MSLSAVPPDDPVPFGAWLADRMRTRGLSVRGLAAEAGVSTCTVQEYRAGSRDPAGMTEETLAGFATALGLSVKALRTRAGIDAPSGPYVPPLEARLLSPADRRLVDAMIRRLTAR